MRFELSSMALLLLVAAVVTAGLVLGISFVAQPVKFSAPGVALAQQVRIGSVIFHASHAVQGVLLLALVLAIALAPALVPAWTAKVGPWAWVALGAGVGIAAMSLALQSVGLMPLLDERVAALGRGQVVPSEPWLHLSYVGLEVTKLLGLGHLAWRAWILLPRS
jgi:hypothetical protein